MEIVVIIFSTFLVLWEIERTGKGLAHKQRRIERKLDRIIDHLVPVPPPIIHYQPVLTPNAETDLIQLHTLQQLSKSQNLVESIRIHLLRDADVESDRRKPLIPETLTLWSLKIDRYRLFYVLCEQKQVKIIAIGYRVHNNLFIRDKKTVMDIANSFEQEQVDLGGNKAFVAFLGERAQEAGDMPLEDIEQHLTQIQIL